MSKYSNYIETGTLNVQRNVKKKKTKRAPREYMLQSRGRRKTKYKSEKERNIIWKREKKHFKKKQTLFYLIVTVCKLLIERQNNKTKSQIN